MLCACCSTGVGLGKEALIFRSQIIVPYSHSDYKKLYPKILLLTWSQGNCLSHWCQGTIAAAKAASVIFSTCHFPKSFHGVWWPPELVTNRDSPWVMLQWIWVSALSLEEKKDLLFLAGEEPGLSGALQEILLCNPQGIKDNKSSHYWDGKWDPSCWSATGYETMPWPTTRTRPTRINRTWDLEDLGPGTHLHWTIELKN